MANLKQRHDSEDFGLKNTLVVRNSYCNLRNFPSDVLEGVNEVLTYQNDIEAEKIQLLKKLKYFKRFVDSDRKEIAAKARKMTGWIKKQLKELQENEFVHWLDGDRFPTGHLNIVKDVLEVLHPKYKTVDRRKLPEKKYNFILQEPFPEPRYYQHQMHEIGMQEGRGVFESAVGTGKSLVLMRLLLELGVKSLIVVPSKPLLNQLHKVLVEHFGPKQVIVLSSTSIASTAKLRKLKKKPIMLINIGSLASINKKGEAQKILQDVNAVFIDEIHHAGSKSYTSLMDEMGDIYHRFGFTGTFLRNDSKTLDMWGFLSNKLYCYPAWKAIEEGFLTPLEVIVHSVKGIRKRNYQSEYKKNYCGGELILEKIHEIFTEYVKKGQQVLILVNRKDQAGLVIHEYLNELGLENTYISGDDDKEDIDDAIREFNDKEISILIGSSVIGEGIDIRSTDHLIMAQGGKSEIAIVQAVGRLARLFKDKLIGLLHDFRFLETKYMEKHLETRKQIYKRNFAPKFRKG